MRRYSIDETAVESGEPEHFGRNVVAAILLQGITDAISLPVNKGARQFVPYFRRDARLWIDSPHHIIGSFNWCCSAIGFDARQIREKLRTQPMEVWTALHQTAARRLANNTEEVQQWFKDYQTEGSKLRQRQELQRSTARKIALST